MQIKALSKCIGRITYEEETATQESLRTGNIGQNEDAFLHIKTLGMYEDQVVLLLSANDGAIELRRETISMKQNRRVVAFDMAETIQRYRQQTNTLTGDVSFTLKATLTILDPNASNTETVIPTTTTPSETTSPERSWGQAILETAALVLTAPLWILSGCTPTNREGTTTTEVATSQVNPSNIIQASTELLSVTCTDADPATKRTSTGTVYVNVNTGETPDITPTKFTDFTIGYITYIEGVGKLVDRNNNSSNNTPARSVYPYNVYEYLLSDLVAIGIITVEDAILIAPRPRPESEDALIQIRQQLERDFNKFTQRIVDNSLLVDKFRDPQNRVAALRTRIKGTVVRKLLFKVRVRPPELSDFICRDGWQDYAGRSSVRYDSGQECPSGEYFLNYVPRTSWQTDARGRQRPSPKYRIGVGQTLINSVIYEPFNRTGIALHNGGATAAVGCITFNTAHNDHGNQIFTQAIYRVNIGPDNGTRIDSVCTDTTIDRKKINFLCLDERNAIQETRDRRFYDLVDRNRNIAG